jgi:hypothetical protein
MKGVAVELDDEPSIQPDRVDLEPPDAHVQGRRRQAGVAAELDEAPLELGAGVGRGSVLVNQRSKGLEPMTAPAARANVRDGAEVEEVQAVGFLERAPELTRADHLAEIDQRPRDRGDRDAVADGAVVRAQAAHAVQRDARLPGTRAACRGDVHA